MARIKGGMNAKRKHNKVLKLAKGYRGARSNQYRIAKQSVMRALNSSANLCMALSLPRSISTARCSPRWQLMMQKDLQHSQNSQRVR